MVDVCVLTRKQAKEEATKLKELEAADLRSEANPALTLGKILHNRGHKPSSANDNCAFYWDLPGNPYSEDLPGDHVSREKLKDLQLKTAPSVNYTS